MTRSDTASSRLGVAIRLRRQRRGLTLQQLAAQAGLDCSQLSKVERGIERTGIDTYERIADALDVPLQRLLASRPQRRSAA